MGSRTWFITGTSRGFGREWAQAALARGDRVVGTARERATLDALAQRHPDTFLPLTLDVTDREAVFSTVQRAHDHFGELDIVVNNAGYGQFGMVEELSEHDARAQIETNLFGALWVTQAALPYLRAQRRGHFLQISSISGITTFPGVGMYNASKWALEGLSQTLAQEVASFGIHVTLIEPGAFDTDWAGPSARRAERIAAYADVHTRREQGAARAVHGDPAATAAAVLRIVDAERPPLRCFFGTNVLALAQADYDARLETWRQWEPVAVLAQGAPR